MELFKFLWTASGAETLRITILVVINGLAGGMLLIFLPDAAIHLHPKGRYLFYGVLLLVNIAVFLISRHTVQLKTEALAGKAVDQMILRMTNTVRHTELIEFQQLSQEDIFLSVAASRTISTAASKLMESFQAYITLLVGWFYIAFYISSLFGLILLGVRMLQVLLQEMFGKIIFSYVREHQQEEKEVFAALQNQLYGFKELKFNKKKREDIFSNYLLPKIEAGKRKRITASLYTAELLLTNILTHMLCMVCCITLSSSLPPYEVSKVVIIMFFFLQNDMLINASVQNVIEGNVALQKLRQLFPLNSMRSATEAVPDPVRQEDERFQSIRIDQVGFSYPVSDNGQGFSITIDDLTINAGKILFVVGGNGSGKSTFMNLLTGLYSPDCGIIEIDGQPISTGEYRDMFSTVFNDFHLFDKFYGIEKVDEQRVQELLQLTGLAGKTQYKSEKFTTQDLSTGQRKRLALVIAMIEDRPIFIFDEWAADQDPHFRRFFYEDILPSLAAQGKTIIAVTHDDRYFHLADKVVRMEYGRIAEQWCPDRSSRKKSADLLQNDTATAKISLHPKRQRQQQTAEHQEGESDSGIWDQFNQFFLDEQQAGRKIFLMLSLFVISVVAVTIIILHASTEQMTTVQYISFIFCLVVMVMSFRRLQKTYHHIVQKRIALMRIDVMNHVRQTDLLTVRKIGTGRIYAALTSDISAVASTSNIVLLCIQGGTRMGMIYLYLAILSPSAFLLVLLLTGLGAFFYFGNHIKTIKLFEQIETQQKKIFDSLHHLLDGFKELKISSRKSNDFYRQALRQGIARLRTLRLSSIGYYNNNATITYGFWMSSMLLILFFLPWIGLAIPAHTLPIVIGLILTMPLRQVIDLYSQFHIAFLSIQSLFRFENRMKNLGREPEALAGAEDLRTYTSIRYENIAFTYQSNDERPFSIGPLNISFTAGETVFITGGNGSGKSTLMNVITGLYPSDSGRIILNQDKEVDIRQYRELFSVIFTDFKLFDRLYGMREEVDEEKLQALLTRFGLEKKVQWIDGRFSTLDLSTGQKKRLALITTIMEDKPIFILDEWAADQDPYFREYFYTTLLPEFKEQGKTVIAVTHDDMYFQTADRVLYLEYGQLKDADPLTDHL
ncbi:MAG: cyclic peptide export ABC transporter [Candidatus Electrothrix sp. AU1_5]|nr:cyclic peptide export ABC transporter [Candidatus Electrothrix gigas]